MIAAMVRTRVAVMTASTTAVIVLGWWMAVGEMVAALGGEV
jgi:hypothetical protein